MNELKKHWENYAHIPYPAQGHIDNLDLELYDANIAAVTMSYIDKANFDGFSIIVIRENVDNLRRVLPQIPPSAQPYFKGLLTLGEKLLSLWE